MLPLTMHSMAVDAPRRRLVALRKPLPVPGANEVLLRVVACGVCRTDLHIIDGELPPHQKQIVPGHEIVGRVVGLGEQSTRFAVGQRVGVPWLGGTCGQCAFCAMRRENLCDEPVFTGYDRDGGFAEYTTAHEAYCLALPDRYDDAHVAPLLCAGLIGFRAWTLAGGARGRRLGLYGFGAAAHIICQIAVGHGQEVYAFTRAGDAAGQQFAMELGAVSAGDSSGAAPVALDAAIIFASDGELVPKALAAVRKGGIVVCAGIHMSPIPEFDYALLWGERTLQSVANLTRSDGEAFFQEISQRPVKTHVQTFSLGDANAAIDWLRGGKIQGAAVLVP